MATCLSKNCPASDNGVLLDLPHASVDARDVCWPRRRLLPMTTHMCSAAAARGSDPATPPDGERERLPGRSGLATPAPLLFASGAAALIYQVVWIKQLSLVVGVDVYAVTTGVSAFFAGLALGGALFGWWVDRLARPFLLYSFLELGVALLGAGGGSWSPGLGAALRACRRACGPDGWNASRPDPVSCSASGTGRRRGGPSIRGQYRGCDRRCPLDLVCPHTPVGCSRHGVRRSCDQPGGCSRSAWSRSCHIASCARRPGAETHLACGPSAYRTHAVCGGRRHRAGLRSGLVPGDGAVHEHPELRLLRGPGDILDGSRHRQRAVRSLGGPGPRSLGSLRHPDRSSRPRGAARDRRLGEVADRPADSG